MTGSPDDLRAAVDVAERMSADAVLLNRWPTSALASRSAFCRSDPSHHNRSTLVPLVPTQ